VRFLRLIGEDVIYMCASDAHGTPIEINATKRGISPKQLVNEFHERHKEDFDGFEISFDEFYTTDSPENQRHCEIIYLRAQDRGHISTREIEQYCCEVCGRFLPDRYIKGTCPKCGAPGSIRRRLRGVRRNIPANRSSRCQVRYMRRNTVSADIQALLFPTQRF